MILVNFSHRQCVSCRERFSAPAVRSVSALEKRVVDDECIGVQYGPPDILQAAGDIPLPAASMDELLHPSVFPTGGLGQRCLDMTDVGDLAARMELEQLQAVLHAAILEEIEAADDLTGGEPELAPQTIG